MQSRTLYQQLYPQIDSEHWLPSEFDGALAGVAERHVQLVPVYAFKLLLEVIPSEDAGERFRRVAGLLAVQPKVAVLHTPARVHFWARVKRKELMAWEGLTPAIKGVMAWGLSKPHAVVYERGKVIMLLTGMVENSDRHGEPPSSVACRDYSQKLKACDAGAQTPWFLFQNE